jgi:aminopeptidase N
MPDIPSEIAAPQPVRLVDYQPPAFLIDTVELVFELADHETRVTSRLRIRRNPDSSDPTAPLH